MSFDRLTPVEQIVRRRKLIMRSIALLLILIGVYYFVFVRTYPVTYEKEVDHFKYGSIGSEPANGLPYWIFKSLPHLFEDKLGPQGYRTFGFLYETPEADLPIGFSKRTVNGLDFVWLNCAVCHTGVYKDPTGEAQLLIGAPANKLKLQEFIAFLRSAAIDSRFTSENVLNSIDAVGGDLNIFESLLYRFYVVGRVQTGLLNLKEKLAFLDRGDLNDWGAGRVDTFNPYKTLQLNFPMDKQHVSALELNSAADYPSIWMQRPRKGMNLHWDGNNASVEERNLSAALGAGVTPVTVDHASLKRLENWLLDFPAPEFPGKIDEDLAQQGAPLYRQYCSVCHGNGLRLSEYGEREYAGNSGGSYSGQSGGQYGGGRSGYGGYGSSYGGQPASYDYSTKRYARLGQIEDLNDVQTDPGRFMAYTEEFAAAQNMLYAGYPWRFSHFKKTNGYANHPLDGIWARSPYLHNGSVPTLRDLLEPSDKRPAVFYRGSKKYDWQRVGYQSYPDQTPLEDGLTRYDTSKLGSRNTGHEGERYGTHLSAHEKDAIVEYMKTF